MTTNDWATGVGVADGVGMTTGDGVGESVVVGATLGEELDSDETLTGGPPVTADAGFALPDAAFAIVPMSKSAASAAMMPVRRG
jgi:hypothetical protein